MTQNASEAYQVQVDRFTQRAESIRTKYDHIGLKLFNDMAACTQQNPVTKTQMLINAVNSLPVKLSTIDLYLLLLNKQSPLPKFLNYQQNDFYTLRYLFLSSGVCGKIGADFASLLLHKGFSKSVAIFAVLETMSPVLIEKELYNEFRSVTSPLSKALGLSKLLSLEESLYTYEKQRNLSKRALIPNVIESWLIMHCGTLGRHLRTEITRLIKDNETRQLINLYDAFETIGELKDEEALYHILNNANHPISLLLFNKKYALNFWGNQLPQPIYDLYQRLSQLERLYQLDNNALLDHIDQEDTKNCGCWDMWA